MGVREMMIVAVVLGQLFQRIAARNWYWALNGRCGQLPVPGQTSIMGHTLADDGPLEASPLEFDAASGTERWELSTPVPYGDWFALASAGTLSGAGPPRCDGAYTYGSSQGGTISLRLSCAEPAPANLSVVVVYGNGYAQTHARTFRLADLSLQPVRPPVRPPLSPPSPPPPPLPLNPPSSALGAPSPPLPTVPASDWTMRGDDARTAVLAGTLGGGGVVLGVAAAACAWRVARARARYQLRAGGSVSSQRA